MKLKVVIAGVFVGLMATACSTVGHAGTGHAGTGHAGTQGSSAVTSAHLVAASQPKPAVFNCLNHPVVKPSSYVLTCADDGSFLYHLKWAGWTAQRATAAGVHELNDCTPNCAEGTFRKYPAIITFWRPEPLAGHHGEKYFTRITVRYTGPRPPMYTSNGQLVKHPASWTQALGS